MLARYRNWAAAALLMSAGAGCAANAGPAVGGEAAPQRAEDSAASGAAEPYTQEIPGTTVGLDMVPIPAGTVQLQTPDGPREVEVGPFWMSRIEVPWDIFDVWVFALDQGIQVATGKGEEAVSRPSRPYVLPGRNFGHDGLPALGMTYPAAAVFAGWLSEATGHTYRLPTVAEWVYACRANQAAPASLGEHAWTFENSADKTHPGGQKALNAFGLADMLGNAGEWAVISDEEAVLKGGTWADPAAEVSCDAGKMQTPAWNATDPQLPKSVWWLTDAPFVGIRLVREP